MAEGVRRWVIEGPAKQGLNRANWTHAELAEHLYRLHGIRASRSAGADSVWPRRVTMPIVREMLGARSGTATRSLPGAVWKARRGTTVMPRPPSTRPIAVATRWTS